MGLQPNHPHDPAYPFPDGEAMWVEEQIAEWLPDLADDECAASRHRDPTVVDVTGLTTWSRGRYGGWAATVTVRCPDCNATSIHELDEDNV